MYAYLKVLSTRQRLRLGQRLRLCIPFRHKRYA